MRNEQIFPASILEQSADQLFNDKTSLSGVLYLVTLIIIVGCLVAMNFIRIDVTVHSIGMIKPREDHTTIFASASGFIKTCNLVPNLHVEEGDTLFVIRSEIITSKLPMLEKRKNELGDLISDLKGLCYVNPFDIRLRSAIYKQEVQYYHSQLNDAEAKFNHAKSAYERGKKLYEADVIPRSEYEPVELEYRQAENAMKSLMEYQKHQWTNDMLKYENEYREINIQIDQIDIQKGETIICSPVTGTIQQLQTIFDGSYVSEGRQILEISPDGDLIAECYVQPKDIGYVVQGMQGRVQVSAFSYSEWGVLDATVEEVFDDVCVSADGKQSAYRIICSLDSNHLELKNGFKGYLKKGMAINANFVVTRRTVFQLLYDKINNWLNPEICTNE